MAVDLDEAEDGREPSEEAETLALGLARRIGLVAEIGVLGLRGNLVVNDSGAGAAECLLADLLGELIEPIAHEPAGTPTIRPTTHDLISRH